MIEGGLSVTIPYVSNGSLSYCNFGGVIIYYFLLLIIKSLGILLFYYEWSIVFKENDFKLVR